MNNCVDKVDLASKSGRVTEVQETVARLAAQTEEMEKWFEGNFGPWDASSNLARGLSAVLTAAQTISLRLGESIKAELESDD
jgi:hypothetical protein